MKKVLFVTTHPELGGAQKWTYSQIGLLQNSYEIYLATGAKGWLSEIAMPFCEGIFIDAKIYGFTSLIYLFRLRQFVKDNQIDMVIASSANAGIYARLLKVFIPTLRVIYVSHGWSSIYRGNYLYQMVEKGLSYLSDNILVISQSDYAKAVDILKISTSKLHLIENAILPCPHQKGDTFLDFDKDTIHVVMVARFEIPKRQDLLIAAAKELDHIHFHFIGEGKGLSSLKQDAPSNTTFWGTLNNIEKVLQKVDIFILLSDSEGLPLSVLESLACGKPMILSDIPSMRTLIQDNGLLVENDVQSVVEALHVMQDENLKHMGEKSKKIFNARFNLKNQKKIYLDYYAELFK